MYQTDDNVLLGAINGEGRQLYAAPNVAGTALVRLKQTSGLGIVVHHTNRNADYSTLATIQLQKWSLPSRSSRNRPVALGNQK